MERLEQSNLKTSGRHQGLYLRVLCLGLMLERTELQPSWIDLLFNVALCITSTLWCLTPLPKQPLLVHVEPLLLHNFLVHAPLSVLQLGLPFHRFVQWPLNTKLKETLFFFGICVFQEYWYKLPWFYNSCNCHVCKTRMTQKVTLNSVSNLTVSLDLLWVSMHLNLGKYFPWSYISSRISLLWQSLFSHFQWK